MSHATVDRVLHFARPTALWIGLILATIALAGHAEPPTPTPVAASMEKLASEALWWADFDELESLYAQASVPGGRTPDGRDLLTAFRVGVSVVFMPAINDPTAYFAQLAALTREWSIQRPESPLAHALYARALLAAALHARGRGNESRVTPQARAEFERYLGQATAHLAAHPEVIAKDSSANVYLMAIGRWRGWPHEQLLAIASHGLKLAPDDFGFDVEMITALLPSWGGNVQAIDRFVVSEMSRVGPERALEIYARLYLEVAWEFQGGLFSQTRADWGKMRQGFRDMLLRYPDARNLNQFAWMACIAQDRETLRELLEQIGKTPVLSQWGSGADGRRQFETCTTWARAS